MAFSRTINFRIETIWPELVNKRLLQVDVLLKEIQFLNHADTLLAKGWCLRQIHYLEFDGRSRRTEDRFQFELLIGPRLADPLPFLKARLQPEYYLFQPRQLGENQSFLEQGFLLTVEEDVPQPNGHPSPPVLLNFIIASETGSLLINSPVDLESNFRPSGFVGQVEFAAEQSPPLVKASLSGFITYSDAEQRIHEREWQGKIDFLLNIPELKTDQELRINGQASDFEWVLSPVGLGWCLQAKLDYQWFLLEGKEVRVSSVAREDPLAKEVHSNLILNQSNYLISRCFEIAYDGPEPYESNLQLISTHEESVAAGVLLEAFLKLELYFIDSNGIEGYRAYTLEVHEFRPEKPVNYSLETVKFKVDLNLAILQIKLSESKLKVDIELKYQIKSLQPTILHLIPTAESDHGILAENLSETRVLSLIGEGNLLLSHLPVRIKKISAKPVKLRKKVLPSWLMIAGELELLVAYDDCNGFERLDFFCLSFQQGYIWDSQLALSELLLQANLEHDSFELKQNNLVYHYLLAIKAELYQTIAIKITILDPSLCKPELPFNGLQRIIPVLAATEVKTFSLEGEINLEQGNPLHIYQDRTKVSKFNFRQAQNAILVEGYISGDLEYWDENGYLKQEVINYPFWKFVNPSSLWFDSLPDLEPRLERHTLTTIKSATWQRKGRLKIKLDFNFQPLKQAGE